jgi:hypothetical protein
MIVLQRNRQKYRYFFILNLHRVVSSVVLKSEGKRKEASLAVCI